MIDGEHIDAIGKTVNDIPATVDVASRELVESTLAETARSENPYTVHKHGDILLRHLDPDGRHPGDRRLPSGSTECPAVRTATAG